MFLCKLKYSSTNKKVFFRINITMHHLPLTHLHHLPPTHTCTTCPSVPHTSAPPAPHIPAPPAPLLLLSTAGLLWGGSQGCASWCCKRRPAAVSSIPAPPAGSHTRV